ncbi:hypothetical protein C8F04DRAFT_1284897 [Mycena alexandri]|uniref:RNase H type-1 domain-containing protein n=1 Tax=Mycena alexandri TaxID=1745969 RepID=A0AAD6RVV1_9AGAR|nr:hypothetical protein C8F04DRAFT_1284897 [Mycena alexandri]
MLFRTFPGASGASAEGCFVDSPPSAPSRFVDDITFSTASGALKGITSTAPRSGQFRAVHYDRSVRSALRQRPDSSIVNLWTPAHIGTAGNELADEAAKDATC